MTEGWWVPTSFEVYTRFWTDDKIRQLSPDGKLLMLYLFTGPHSEGTGIFRLYPEVVRHHTGLGTTAFSRALDELKAQSLVRWEPERRLVWVVNRLRYRFPGGISPKQAKGLVRSLEDLPQESPLLAEFVTHYEAFLNGLPEGIGKAFMKGSGACTRAPLSSSSPVSSPSLSIGGGGQQPDPPPQDAAWEGFEDVRRVLAELQVDNGLADPAYWKAIDAWIESSGFEIYYLDELKAYVAHQRAQPAREKHKDLRRGFRNWLATAKRWKERDAQREAVKRTR